MSMGFNGEESEDSEGSRAADTLTRAGDLGVIAGATEEFGTEAEGTNEVPSLRNASFSADWRARTETGGAWAAGDREEIDRSELSVRESESPASEWAAADAPTVTVGGDVSVGSDTRELLEGEISESAGTNGTTGTTAEALDLT